MGSEDTADTRADTRLGRSLALSRIWMLLATVGQDVKSSAEHAIAKGGPQPVAGQKSSHITSDHLSYPHYTHYHVPEQGGAPLHPALACTQ